MIILLFISIVLAFLKILESVKVAKDSRVSFIAKKPSRNRNPFCLILASDYPHGPHPSISSYEVSDIIKHPYDFRVNPKKTGYYEFIKNDDIQLTSILKIIDDRKLAENSVFIYMADHGYSGKFTLYQKGIKVPFIMRWPNKIDAGSKNLSLIHI